MAGSPDDPWYLVFAEQDRCCCCRGEDNVTPIPHHGNSIKILTPEEVNQIREEALIGRREFRECVRKMVGLCR